MEPDTRAGAGGAGPLRFVLAGVVIFVVGMGLHPHGGAPRGERWTIIGGAED